jgi:hypothetical protein
MHSGNNMLRLWFHFHYISNFPFSKHDTFRTRYPRTYVPFRLQNVELHGLYRSPNIVRVIKTKRSRWAGHVARMEEDMSAFKILAGIPTGKGSLWKPKCRWEDNIRMDLEEIVISIRGIWLIRLRIWIIWEPLWIGHGTSGFHKPWSLVS